MDAERSTPSEPDYDLHPEKPIWEKWQREGGRCPYCVGVDDRDWLAMCDCWEAERVLIDKGPVPDVR